MPAERSGASAGRLRAMLARLVNPADDRAQPGERRGPSVVMLMMAGVLAILVMVGGCAVLLALRAGSTGPVLSVLVGLPVTGALLLGAVMFQVKRHLLRPMAELRTWALSMCNGDLSSRIPSPQKGEFAKLAFHINRLSDALERLANEMDDMVHGQTERLTQKNRSLEVLYDFAATVTRSRDLDDLLDRSARKLMGVVGARAATVRLRTDDGHMRLVKSIGFEGEADAEPPALIVDGNAFSEIEALLGHQPPDGVAVDRPGGTPDMGLITVPLRYRGRNLGVYNLFTATPELAEDAEVMKLLESVGRHLGMAIDKAHLDQESKHLSIMRERTSLAHELHDSLAQTLASLRFQVKMLGETLQGSGNQGAQRELERIKNSLDEAHTELRELLANFRAPIDERGLLPAVEDLVNRFRSESGISTYFQQECPGMRLAPAQEMQVLRIVREALGNVRKHSGAHTVRVLLRRAPDGEYTILIEDDGVGIGLPVLQGHPGEHLGLSIMQERARRLGGRLGIESEPGEGTRVLLRFRSRAEALRDDLRADVA